MPRSLVPNQFDYSGVYVEGKRSYFRFNKTHLASFMSGMLVPMGDPIFVIPGAKMELLMDNVIRSNTMVVPPLDGMYIDTFAVWVPHRIVFNGTPQFIGENDQTAWTQSVETVLPTVYFENINNYLFGAFNDGNISDVDLGNLFLNVHYGLFANKEIVDASSTPGDVHEADSAYHVPINVIAHRGYYAIWNHFFRDENYQRPVLFSKGTNGGNGEFGYSILNYNLEGNGFKTLSGLLSDYDGLSIGDGVSFEIALLMPVNKFHDWAQSLLPQAQFGSPVELAMADAAEVRLKTDLDETIGGNFQKIVNSALNPVTGESALGTDDRGGFANPGDDYDNVWLNPNGSLYADLSTATAVTINQLRSAVMYQRYLEALGRGGRRVVEFYENIYSVKNSVAAKDYPQMMSHQRYILGVNQVVATADSAGSGWTSHLGDTGAYSLTTLRNIPVCKGEFTEFGYLHILYCVRADNRYSSCTPKHFTYKSLLDIYNPYFDHIGDVDMPAFLVNNRARGKTNMGFQEAWWEERSQQGLVVGALNKIYGSLSYWSVGEAYDATFKTTTPSSLVFNPAVFNDLFVSAYQVYPQFIMDCRIHGKTAKRMSLHSVPGIVGRI